MNLNDSLIYGSFVHVKDSFDTYSYIAYRMEDGDVVTIWCMCGYTSGLNCAHGHVFTSRGKFLRASLYSLLLLLLACDLTSNLKLNCR